MNKFENKVREDFEREGWEVLTSGWPDFLLVKRDSAGKTKEIQALEVKSKKDDLRSNQKEMLYVLSDFIPVRVAREGCGYGQDRDGFYISIVKRDLFTE